MRFVGRLRFWFLVRRGHVHDWGQTWVDVPRDDGTIETVLSAGTDCSCGRCPVGYCDGTRQPEPGWDKSPYL